MVDFHVLVDQIGLFSGVHLKLVPPSLPMRRKDHDGLGSDFCCDFFADLLKFLVGWVVRLVHDVRLDPLLST